MSTSAPDSRWWYLVLAVPVYYVLATVLGFVVGFAAFVAALTGAGGAGPGGPGAGAEVAVGFGVVGVVVLVLLLFLVGLALTLAFPVAIYFDAEAVADRVGAGTRHDAGSATVGNTMEGGETVADATETTGTTAAGETTDGWRPDPALYGLLGLAGVVAQPLQVPLAVYYLYKRHEATGVP